LTTCSIDLIFICLDSNLGYLVHESIALPTKLQEYLEYFIRTQDTNYTDFQNHADFSSPRKPSHTKIAIFVDFDIHSFTLDISFHFGSNLLLALEELTYLTVVFIDDTRT